MKNKKIEIKSLPFHVDCGNLEIKHCDYFMRHECKESCGYALDIRGIGIGALDSGIAKVIQNEKDTLEAACCPIFSTEDCGVEVSRRTYNKLCLKDYQSCEIYLSMLRSGM